MTNEGLKPSFEEEFPDAVEMTPNEANRYELGQISLREAIDNSKVAAVPKIADGPKASVSNATHVLGEGLPKPEEVTTPVDQTAEDAKVVAAKIGGHPDDYDWRMQ